ncbi:MAG: helix-turn-helix domain-containing protein [Magnetospirillum gryphiswaldense]|uniref:Helix-turn-helix domain-containing protein n=1 Tax=Magnetospirillum sulfuroxidans TaxID=611300 RepID=A0ABS5IGM2_9PROT|nr:helix-turn-helix domain-containing protein [Magnetospirillum gryphiswaldense]MBR9973582.1 helix-turn-helix domain-containing protein [Magnetospirillum sulfuroxidans]
MNVVNNVNRLTHSVSEACRIIGVGRSSFYKAVKKGQITILKCGRRTLVPTGECEAFLSRLAEESGK